MLLAESRPIWRRSHGDPAPQIIGGYVTRRGCGDPPGTGGARTGTSEMKEKNNIDNKVNMANCDRQDPSKPPTSTTLQWRHNDQDGVSNHQPRCCLLNCSFRRRSKKTSKFRVTGLCVGNSPGPVNSPHKGPVTRKMFPFDDVIMDHMKFANYSHRLYCVCNDGLIFTSILRSIIAHSAFLQELIWCESGASTCCRLASTPHPCNQKEHRA